MSSRRFIYCFLAAASILSLLLGYVACLAFLPFQPTIREWNMSGSWITTAGDPGYVGYFRKEFLLPAEIRTAWIAVSACDAYEVIVNGEEIGSQKLVTPNLPFQFTTSEIGQRINQFRVAQSVSYPRDYQWETYANYRIPIFFDLTRFLKRGRNCVCVRVNARKAPVALCAQGEVLLQTGARLPLDSSLDWRTAIIPRLDVSASWTDAQYSDRAWPAAVAARRPGLTFRSFSPEIFSEPFQGKWITPAHASRERSIWFVSKWKIHGHPDEAWVKLVTNRHYSLYINGHRAESPTLGPNELGAGDWIVHTPDASGKQWQPDSMDPDNAGSLFSQQLTADDLAADAGGTATPIPLLHDEQVGAFDAYSVGAMLRDGDNEVAVRLVQPGPLLKWAPKLALDASAVSANGRSTLRTNAADWTAELPGSGNRPASLEVVEFGEAITGLGLAPTMRYLGYCYSSGQKLWGWLFLGGAIFLSLTGILLLLISRRIPLLDCVFGKGEISASESRYLATGTAVIVSAAAVLFCTLVADACFAARDDVLVFMTGHPWMIATAASGIVALLAGLLLWAAPGFPPRLPAVARTYGFPAALSAILALCAVLRIYGLQFQSTDPDEWASLQPILAIADKGVPMLTEDVYYTRSPFYHYLVGGLVAIFGKSFWVFRLPSAIFAVATAALIYLTGKTLLRSRWTGLAAAALFCLHPLLIDIGHHIRFYQQQQFFALLTIYCFCRGFVEGQQMKWRYMTLAAFVPAIFSQEISVIIGFTLVASYFLFAERKAWPMEMRFMVALGCVVTLVVLDFAMYQTVCLSVHDRMSPRIEPEMKLNLMFPSMLYWFFILFSRLHFGSTVFFFLGLPFALRDRNRSALMLCITFFSGIVLTMILITSSGIRFQYWLMPVYFLLLVHGMTKFAEWAMKPAAAWFQEREPALRGALVAMSVVTVLITWSPWKIPGSYSMKILPDVDGALAFVRHNILPRDALAVAAPHTTAALVEVGRVDYDVELPLLYDFVYRKNGRLLDRNAGAEVISRLDEFQDACARHERLWLVLTRGTRFRSPGETITWQEPGARFDLFVRTNLELKYQTYLADVFLWDSSKGRLKDFQRAW